MAAISACTDQYDLATLVALAEEVATELADGHLTIMRLTCKWKVMLTTPDMTPYWREQIWRMPAYPTLIDALRDMLVSEGQSADYHDLAALVSVAEKLARRKNKGYLTLLRFTTGWKAFFGRLGLTPIGRDEVRSCRTYETIDKALLAFLLD